MRSALVIGVGCGVLLAGCSSSSSGGSASPTTSITPNASATPTASVAPTTTGAPTGSGQTFETSFDVVDNLNALADSEVGYLRAQGEFTTSGRALAEHGGYVQAAVTKGNPVFIGIDGTNGFCIVSAPTVSGPWLLDDPHNGGVVPRAFKNAKAAESACSNPKITRFAAAF